VSTSSLILNTDDEAESVAPEKQCKPAPRAGALAQVDAGRAVYVLQDRYVVWVLRLDAPALRLDVDDADVMPLAQAAFNKRDFIEVGDVELTQMGLRAPRLGQPCGKLPQGTPHLHPAQAGINAGWNQAEGTPADPATPERGDT